MTQQRTLPRRREALLFSSWGQRARALGIAEREGPDGGGGARGKVGP